MSNIRLFYPASLLLNLNSKLDKSQSHYVNKVMRVKVNETFSLFNSNGEWEAKVKEIKKGIIEIADLLVVNKLTANANTACFQCTHMRLKVLFEKMKLLNADYIATGHFAKVRKNLNSEEYFIHSNNDKNADQSYLLAGLDSFYLKHLILPLGELSQEEVEKIGKKFKISTENPHVKKSHFCFRKKDSYLDYANSKVPKSLLKEGNVQDIDTETIYTDHDGILSHYITEKSLSFNETPLADKELEIVDYNFVSGTIYVGKGPNLTHQGFQLVDLKIGKGLDITKPMICYLKSKNANKYYKAHLFFKNNSSALIECFDSMYPIIPGEIFVIYDRDTRNSKVIGQGRIGNIGDFQLVDRVNEFRADEVKEEQGEDERPQEKSIFKF